MRTQNIKVSLVAGTLVIALLSSMLLSHPWHMAFIEGHTFTGVLGTEITTLALLSAVPLLWPFLVVGILLGWRASHSSDVKWALGLGVAGALLRLLLSRAEFSPEVDFAGRLSYFAVVPTPLVLSVVGFYAARLFRTQTHG